MSPKDKLNNRFVELILSESPLDENEVKQFQNVLEAAKKLYENHKWHVPYEIITKEIYSKSEIELEKLDRSVEEKFSKFKPNNFLNQIKNDTLRNIHLAIVQKNYIDENIIIANKELEEIQETKRNIYTDFIAILGIFTAITFAIFGGLQLIGNCLNNLKGWITLSKVGSILIIASVILLSTYLILMALIVGLSKLLSGDKNNRYKFTGKITAWIIGAIIGLFIIGCLFIKKS
nr:hypothetical protein [uncultured Ligilactobacillus sp.]